MTDCPYPVIFDSGRCCKTTPCAVTWFRPCDAEGGCWDRSTCGDCSEPVFPAELTQCDCCGAMVPEDQIRTVIAYGIKTSACDACRGGAERCETTRPAKICPVFRAITGGV